MRLQRAPASFDPHVDVTIRPESIVIVDNGVGMTRDEVRSNFWRAGSSGKNTAEARAAGVVGTFGIGAMANFGIASELEVITESAATGERTRSFARKAELSTSKKCISIEEQPSTSQPGLVLLHVAESLDVTGDDELPSRLRSPHSVRREYQWELSQPTAVRK
jgi:molecular chaperone HtpG